MVLTGSQKQKEWPTETHISVLFSYFRKSTPWHPTYSCLGVVSLDRPGGAERCCSSADHDVSDMRWKNWRRRGWRWRRWLFRCSCGVQTREKERERESMNKPKHTVKSLFSAVANLAPPSIYRRRQSMVEINKHLPLFSAGLVHTLLLQVLFFIFHLFSVFAEMCCILFYNPKSMIWHWKFKRLSLFSGVPF